MVVKSLAVIIICSLNLVFKVLLGNHGFSVLSGLLSCSFVVIMEKYDRKGRKSGGEGNGD